MDSTAKMNRRVSFQVPSTGRTGMGAPQKGFAHSFYAWVSREQIGSGNEQYINDRLLSPYSFKYKAHFQKSINETMRIVDDSVTYNILSITPDDLRMFVEIITEKIAE